MSDTECEACGHLRSLHSAVDIGDPSVGVEPTERFERELRVLVERGELPSMLEVRA